MASCPTMADYLITLLNGACCQVMTKRAVETDIHLIRFFLKGDPHTMVTNWKRSMLVTTWFLIFHSLPSDLRDLSWVLQQWINSFLKQTFQFLMPAARAFAGDRFLGTGYVHGVADFSMSWRYMLLGRSSGTWLSYQKSNSDWATNPNSAYDWTLTDLEFYGYATVGWPNS